MKKLGIFLMALVMLMLANTSIPSSARASTCSFSFQYSFDPEITGVKGGDVELLFQIKNTGLTEFNWVEVSIDTAAPYTQRWNTIFTPNGVGTCQWTVPFQAADVNVQKRLRVSVGITDQPDGHKDAYFTIDGTQNLLRTSLSLSKTGHIYAGNTVEFEFGFRNEMRTDNIKDLKVYTYLAKDGDQIAKTQQENFGDVPPGQSVSQTLSYKFKSADIGSVDVYYYVRYSYLGRTYTANPKIKVINVEKPAATPSAAPTAAPSTIAPTASPTAAETPENAATETSQPTATVEAAPADSSPAATPDAALDPATQAKPETGGVSATLFIVVVAGIVVIAGSVIAFLLLRKPGRR
jgi:hypothetical protein